MRSASQPARMEHLEDSSDENFLGFSQSPTIDAPITGGDDTHDGPAVADEPSDEDFLAGISDDEQRQPVRDDSIVLFGGSQHQDSLVQYAPVKKKLKSQKPILPAKIVALLKGNTPLTDVAFDKGIPRLLRIMIDDRPGAVHVLQSRKSLSQDCG